MAFAAYMPFPLLKFLATTLICTHSYMLTMFAVDSQQSNALRCLGGIVIYSVDKTKFLLDLGSGLITCESGESCGLYSWINTDQSDITSKM